MPAWNTVYVADFAAPSWTNASTRPAVAACERPGPVGLAGDVLDDLRDHERHRLRGVALDGEHLVAVHRERLRVRAGVELEHAEAALHVRARPVGGARDDRIATAR